MTRKLPLAPGSYSPSIMQQTLGLLERFMQRSVQVDTVQDELILKSDNGTKYGVTVSDAGVLTVTAK